MYLRRVIEGGKVDAAARSLDYMGLTAGTPFVISIDTVFIGSRTNGRIEDLGLPQPSSKAKRSKRACAPWWFLDPALCALRPKKRARPISLQKGFERRLAGCSMCLAMNPDQLQPRERCAATSNRNFEGRQGRGGRTHLMSPAMAAAAAVRESYRCGGRRCNGQIRKNPASFYRPDHIDTDMIIPKVFLKTIKRSGLGINLFDEMRYDGEGKEMDFVLNKPQYRMQRLSSPVIIRPGHRANTRLGRLRILAFAVISTSFADIFYNNKF